MFKLINLYTVLTVMYFTGCVNTNIDQRSEHLNGDCNVDSINKRDINNSYGVNTVKSIDLNGLDSIRIESLITLDGIYFSNFIITPDTFKLIVDRNTRQNLSKNDGQIFFLYIDSLFLSKNRSIIKSKRLRETVKVSDHPSYIITSYCNGKESTEVISIPAEQYEIEYSSTFIKFDSLCSRFAIQNF